MKDNDSLILETSINLTVNVSKYIFLDIHGKNVYCVLVLIKVNSFSEPNVNLQQKNGNYRRRGSPNKTGR